MTNWTLVQTGAVHGQDRTCSNFLVHPSALESHMKSILGVSFIRTRMVPQFGYAGGLSLWVSVTRHFAQTPNRCSDFVSNFWSQILKNCISKTAKTYLGLLGLLAVFWLPTSLHEVHSKRYARKKIPTQGQMFWLKHPDPSPFECSHSPNDPL
jgi:hypothetical protein